MLDTRIIGTVGGATTIVIAVTASFYAVS